MRKNLDYSEMREFFRKNPEGTYMRDAKTSCMVSASELEPYTMIEYAEVYDTETKIGVFVNEDEIVHVENAMNARSLIAVEKYVNGRWELVPNANQTPLSELIEHTDDFQEDEIIRVTDLMGSHNVIDEEHGFTDPSGIYLIAVSPADFIEAYSDEIVHATYSYDEDDDEYDEEEEGHPLDACDLTYVPASHLINYIRRYSSVATAAKLIKLD